MSRWVASFCAALCLVSPAAADLAADVVQRALEDSIRMEDGAVLSDQARYRAGYFDGVLAASIDLARTQEACLPACACGIREAVLDDWRTRLPVTRRGTLSVRDLAADIARRFPCPP